jgi:hypothetical protein
MRERVCLKSLVRYLRPHAGIRAGCDTESRSNLLRLETQTGRNPMFCHWYSTKTCKPGNGSVRSSWDNVSLTRREWSSNREGR